MREKLQTAPANKVVGMEEEEEQGAERGVDRSNNMFHNGVSGLTGYSYGNPGHAFASNDRISNFSSHKAN